jgi:alkaline phosphatase
MKIESKYKAFSILIVIAVISVSAYALPVISKQKNGNEQTWGPTWTDQKIDNVIVMVPDGCSQSIQTLARWYKGQPLNLDEIQTGTVSTYMANSIITGSAAAATAFATGQKTTVRFLSVGPRTSDLLPVVTPIAAPYEPIATVLEGAELLGKATGLVSTSRITHATPAAYACHIDDRGKDNEIMEHMVYEDVDVVFGGGKRHLITIEDGGKRTDGENLVDVLISRGYHFVETKSEMESVKSGKVWGMFANSHMEAEIDRTEFAPEQPSIAEMTGKAIELLSQDKDGFFLMVEGSQVDWAGHANDPAYMVTDFLAFDDAVGIALDFAKQDKKTLVLVFPDHNTGALSIGSYYQDSNAIGHGYTATTIDDLIEPISEMQITSTGLVRKLAELESPTNEDIKNIFSEWWGLDITEEDIVAMDLSDSYSISEYISKTYTVFGWTTHGHTGEDVPLWAYGPKNCAPTGQYDNTELARIVARSLGFSLEIVTDRLFVNVAYEFDTDEWELDFTDPNNPVLKIVVDKDLAELPTSKDLLYIDGSEINLEGIIVYAPLTGQVYIPEQVISYIK